MILVNKHFAAFALRRRPLAVLLFLWAGMTVVPCDIFAHHFFKAGFDVTKPVFMSGTLKSVVWTNPHILIYVDIPDSNGTPRRWEFQTVSPAVLKGTRWSKDTLKTGDHLTVVAFLALSGHRIGVIESVVLWRAGSPVTIF